MTQVGGQGQIVLEWESIEIVRDNYDIFLLGFECDNENQFWSLQLETIVPDDLTSVVTADTTNQGYDEDFLPETTVNMPFRL